MTTNRMFPDVPLLGERAPDETSVRPPAAPVGAARAFHVFGNDHPYQHVAHQFGYIAPVEKGAVPAELPIQSAGTVEADPTLKGKRIVVRLDALRIHEYPGGGVHSVLLTFKGLAQVAGAAEPVSFSRTYRGRDGQPVAVLGQPIFVGLEVGGQGVAFQCSTVNVKSAGDDAVLQLLDSGAFASGLELVSTAQPVLKPFTEITVGIAKTLARRNENALVQDFNLGLDFDSPGPGARLRTGTFVAAQVPKENAIRWNEWVFDLASGAVVNKATRAEPLAYNYLLFRVSRYP